MIGRTERANVGISRNALSWRKLDHTEAHLDQGTRRGEEGLVKKSEEPKEAKSKSGKRRPTQLIAAVAIAAAAAAVGRVVPVGRRKRLLVPRAD